MLPTFHQSQKIFVWKFGKIKKGDIVVFQNPRDRRITIKRIIKLREGAFFAVGDNISGSTDSRHFGWIEKKYLLGKVIYPR